MEKYTTHTIPHELTLQKSYLQVCYEKKMQEIKSSLKDKFIWVSIDETTDITGRYVANVIVGEMTTEPEKSKKSYLLTSEQLERTNHTTISRFLTMH